MLFLTLKEVREGSLFVEAFVGFGVHKRRARASLGVRLRTRVC